MCRGKIIYTCFFADVVWVGGQNGYENMVFPPYNGYPFRANIVTRRAGLGSNSPNSCGRVAGETQMLGWATMLWCFKHNEGVVGLEWVVVGAASSS